MLTVKGKDDKIISKMMLEMMSSYYNKIINKGVELWVRRLIGLVKKGSIILGAK